MSETPLSDAERKMQFLFHLRSKGVTDSRVLEAMEAIDRGAFVKGIFADRAYEDMPLPIASGQTISQPSVVGLMTQALEVTSKSKVLEVGTGSGYQAAILRHLVDRVVSIERFADLAAGARARLDALGLDDVAIHVGDGTLGWPSDAPYDAIVVTAAGPRVPPALVDQLAPGGRLVAPVGPPRRQRLLRLVRTADGVAEEDLGSVAFVPLVGEQGWPG